MLLCHRLFFVSGSGRVVQQLANRFWKRFSRDVTVMPRNGWVDEKRAVRLGDMIAGSNTV